MNNHPGTELKIYELTNKDTGERHLSVSDNAQDACKQASWLIGGCYVREVKPERKARKDDHSALMVKIPCKVCSFQYGECKKPAEAECPVQTTTPELKDWLLRAAEAHLCDYYGQELSKNDYHLSQKWLPMEQAIEELGDHR